ncbi:sigma-54 dependent transcriptional regulator [Brucepastera parasyntrophica]|uniref:sigma-54-dependent transcriptional regulator n=1 Tax=Brucepastera parasyntrophica TaxID=2880008 RepID=UPI00210EACA2|nr:sigma-54 dependent transcriptional regulator [Brucepastera parasyntrophica]ULQ60300.1 sigma-54 dependent transcriptional regulator [Brucepastera parasyntrophica]
MNVLIVDDERGIRDALEKYLSLEHIESKTAEDGEKAKALLETEYFDVILLDLKLPGISGQEVLEWIQARGIRSPVIMISAHGQIADAVKALTSGASDYLTKPFEPAELLFKLKNLVENRRRENLLEAEKRTAAPENGFIGNSPVMKTLSEQIDRIAGTDTTILITGESGTGKEVAAREIHARGTSSAEPFVAVNIGGINENLMESELFGHEKGSFTGAFSRKPGLFELAGGGTLFLDEIGEMPLPLQVKLLRVLQERKIRRLGGTTDIPVKARIISATNKNIELLVREGQFREDLYYRLNVFRIHLPPLRERREDIPLLAGHLLDKNASRMGKAPRILSAAALEKLSSYSFPGNIRELENILERSLIFAQGNEVSADDIELPRLTGESGPVYTEQPFRETVVQENSMSSLEDIKKNTIREALLRNGGNRTKAAEELGVSRRTIINKIKAYGLE